MRIFYTCFFHFILLFWYQVFTWICDSPNVSASSILSGVDKYFCVSNFFSNPISCNSVNTVLLLLHFFGRARPSEQDGDLVRTYTGRGIGTLKVSPPWSARPGGGLGIRGLEARKINEHILEMINNIKLLSCISTLLLTFCTTLKAYPGRYTFVNLGSFIYHMAPLLFSF